MNGAQIKDPVSHKCLAGAVVHPGLLHKRWKVKLFLYFHNNTMMFSALNIRHFSSFFLIT